MIKDNKVFIKFSNLYLYKLQTALKNQTGATLRTNIEKSELRNSFENIMSTDVKMSKDV